MCIRRGSRKKEKTETVKVSLRSSMAGASSSSNENNNNNNNEKAEDYSNYKENSHEIEKKKLEMKGKVQLHLARIDQETKRLAAIRQELEALSDPTQKELTAVRKRIDVVDKELKPLELTVQRKEKEYKDTLDAFNEKNKEKVQLVTRLMELVGESEKMRMEKLEELSKSIEPVQIT